MDSFFPLLLHFRHARVANLHALLVTLLPGSVGLSLHLLRSPKKFKLTAHFGVQ